MDTDRLEQKSLLGITYFELVRLLGEPEMNLGYGEQKPYWLMSNHDTDKKHPFETHDLGTIVSDYYFAPKFEGNRVIGVVFYNKNDLLNKIGDQQLIDTLLKTLEFNFGLIYEAKHR